MNINGPSCTACGGRLRWIGEWNAWGCDRCRVTYPAQAAAPSVAAAPPAERSRSRRRWIAIGVAVAVVGGAAIVVAATRGGGDVDVTASPQDLLQAALDHARRGDDAGLAALGGGDAQIDAMIDCRDATRIRDMKEGLHHMVQKRIVDDAGEWKDVSATVVAVEPKGRAEDLSLAKDLDGCTQKSHATEQRFKATVRLRADGGSGSDEEHAITFSALEVDGHWYLLKMPEAPPTGDLGRLTKMRDAMCACHDLGCTEKVNKDYADFTKKMETKFKDARPDVRFAKVGMEMSQCEVDAAGSDH